MNPCLKFSVWILGLLVLTSGCVPKKKYIASEQQVTTLEQSLRSAHEQLALSRDSLDLVQDQLKMASQKIATQSNLLRDENDALRTENERIKKQLTQFQQKEENLRQLQAQWLTKAQQLCNTLDSGVYAIRSLQQAVEITIADDWIFKSGTAKIETHSQPFWQLFARAMAEDSTAHATLIVHTDNVTTANSSIDAGQSKASALLKMLIELMPATRQISAGTQGAVNPIASNQTEDGRAQNRRVVITIRYVHE